MRIEKLKQAFDVETVLERAKTADNDGARRLKIRQLMFVDIGVDETRLDRQLEREYSWRGTRRPIWRATGRCSGASPWRPRSCI